MINKKFWYKEVTENLDKIVEALDYFKKLHAIGEKRTTMKGVLHRLLEEESQVMQDYDDALTDCQMIYKWLDEQIKYLKAKKRIEFMKDDDLKGMKKTDIENFVVADDNIQLHIQLMLMIELWCGQLSTLVARLKKRGMYLMMISRLRINGEHEVFIDTTHETDIETL